MSPIDISSLMVSEKSLLENRGSEAEQQQRQEQSMKERKYLTEYTGNKYSSVKWTAANQFISGSWDQK
eukprot:Awhi_evm1s1297